MHLSTNSITINAIVLRSKLSLDNFIASNCIKFLSTDIDFPVLIVQQENDWKKDKCMTIYSVRCNNYKNKQSLSIYCKRLIKQIHYVKMMKLGYIDKLQCRSFDWKQFPSLVEKKWQSIETITVDDFGTKMTDMSLFIQSNLVNQNFSQFINSGCVPLKHSDLIYYTMNIAYFCNWIICFRDIWG